MVTHVYQDLIVAKKNFFDVQEGVMRIKSGKMAYHHEEEGMYGYVVNLFNEHEICDLSTVAFGSSAPAGMVIKKGSSYRELFNIGLLRLLEYGVIDKEHTKSYTKKPRCTRSLVEMNPVEFITVIAPLFILGLGFLVGSGIFIVEIVVHQYQERVVRRRVVAFRED